MLLLAIVLAVAVTYVLFCLTLVTYGLAKRWLTARWARVIAAGPFLAFALPIALFIADIVHRFKTGTLN